ncbi:hypothetical protein HJG53_08005 [Sphingomonas sp. ID1715]|uniref:hypothetical protein n=1 Tax=Sphingomonas sp. ID1715 TaxID=1656898 RepID=UPI00148930F7|nr:hypothetical protein [Sphingomonas sp. ID1715]NNM76839.1 hypothetical protein [Sphingomonas sp. ID1715]
MPSSTSSSDLSRDDYWVRPMAERVAPPIDWVRALLVALLVIALGVGAWEAKMRAEGLTTADLGDSNVQWARERRRVDADPNATVIVGSSRLMFDVDTLLWGKLTGRQPIQLAREGTSPRPVLADLAKDPKVRGLVVVGYDPLVFWGRGGSAVSLVKEAKDEPLFKRLGLPIFDRLAGTFAFLDGRMDPQGWLEHLDVPQRTARGGFNQPWKLSESGAGRNSWMWSRVETDAAYRKRAASIWLLPPPPWAKPLTKAEKDKAIAEVARDVRLIRARGGEVVFVRSPSDPPLIIIEDKIHPRSQSWERLLAATRAPGIYWQDDPVLRQMHTVELSHLSRSDRTPFTIRLVELLRTITPRISGDRTKVSQSR